ncbi:CD97 antigen [Spatholobus suberectus]|nr:CD97 antigen [Spatholobus suberectus]
MGLKATQMQLALVLLFALAKIGTAAADQALRGCRNTCGNIDECMKEKHTCISHKNCRNTIGNYTCFCHKWQSGNGRKEGGCRVHTMVVIGKQLSTSNLFYVIIFFCSLS